MGDGIGVQVIGARKVALRFEQFPQKAHDKILERMTPLTEELEKRIKAAAPRKTGKLQDSIEHAVYDDKPKKIVGRVGVEEDFSKAGALEYGAFRNIKLKGHPASLDHFWLEKLGAPIMVFRKAHSRQQNLVARKFMRLTLHSFAQIAILVLKDAVSEAIDEEPT